MTRKLIHLTFLVLSLSLASCSMFSSGSKSTDSETAEEATNLGDDSASADSDDFGDLDVEDDKPSTSEVAGKDEDSFGDIENFNNGLIENELSDQDLGSKTAAKGADGNINNGDLDVENADLFENPAKNSNASSAAATTTITPTPAAPVTPTEESSLVGSDNKITNLEYKSFDSGGTVVITAEKPFVYQVREEPSYNQTIIEVGDVVLPERFTRPYIAKDFGQPVATINAYQDKGSTTARFVIQYKDKMKPSIQQRQNSLLVMSQPSGATPGATVDAGMEVTAVPSAAATGAVTVGGSATADASGKVNPIAGKRITIEFYGADIKQVIQYIADDVGVNLIIDDDATGVVNVHLRNVEWEEGLSQILNAHGLGYERRGQILRIAKIDKMTKEIREAQERVKAETDNDKLTLPKVMKIIPINYGDLGSLVSQISPLLDKEEKVTADARSNSLVVTGFPTSITRVEQLVKALDIEPLQVMIEGKIIEANNGFSKQFGIRWNSKTTFDVGGNTAGLTSTVQGDSVPSLQNGGFLADLSVGSIDVLGDLTAVLSIFENESKIKILSSPKITVLNKENAKIRQVTNLPTFSSQTQAGGASNVTTSQVTYTPATLQLDITPQISANSDMILEIKVDRDVPGAPLAGGSVPVNPRHAETKIRIHDGQSAVLGGIFNIDERTTETGVPWLKDIPILGYLFKSKNYDVTKNELVVFLYPKILKPSSAGPGGSEMSHGSGVDSELESL